MAKQVMSKADCITELLRVYKVIGKPYTRRQYNEIGKVWSQNIERLFGTWSKALDESGLSKRFDEWKKIQDEHKSFRPEDEVKRAWEEKKNELVERAEERKVKWLREQMNKIDLLREMLEETLAKAEPPVFEVNPIRVIDSSKKRSNRRKCTLWFEFSDLQLGTLMTAEEMGGLNKHNWVIWLDKLKVWKEEAIRIIRTHLEQHYEIDHIVFACLGDMVEGQDIFKGQLWQIDRHVVDQCIMGANDTAAAFAEVMMTFPDLDFQILEVFGNHGRVQRKGESPYSCSMDKVYQRMLEMHLLRIPKLKNMTYHHNESWFYLAEIYGWNHLLLHGDQGMSGLWSNRPTINGLEKGLVRYTQMLQQPIHFLHAGHFHNEWALSFNMSYMLINGSWIGTSNFSATQMVASAPPVQTVHVFEPDVGLAKTERIYLAPKDVAVPMEPNKVARRSK